MFRVTFFELQIPSLCKAYLHAAALLGISRAHLLQIQSLCIARGRRALQGLYTCNSTREEP